MQKHGFTPRMLSDASLAVTDLYNLRHSDGKTPIVTTILIDATGIVRWIDLAPDYRKRNDGKFVLAHVTEALAAAPAAAAPAPPPAEAAPAATDTAPAAATVDANVPVAVVLTGVGPHPIDVVKEIRALTDLGLAHVKAMVDSVPSTVLEGLSPTAARLRAASATVDLRPTPEPAS